MNKNEKGRVMRDDLTGQVHANGTTAISFHSTTSNGGSKWNLKCACGTELVAWAESFKRGVVCRECRNEKLRKARTTHGGRYTVEYQVWQRMLSRCRNPNHQDYPRYGGAGITVSSELETYKGFIKVLGQRPEGMRYIHRYPPDASYTPSTVKWATTEEQNNERRNSQLLTFNGKTQTWSQWSRELGIDKTTIRKRALNGWSPEMILYKGKFHKSRLTSKP